MIFKKKLLNFFGLVFGFALGQGSMFLVQTHLIIDGKIDIVADMGLAFTVVSFFQIIVDWGGVTVLSKYANDQRLSAFIFSALFIRLIISIIVCFIVFFFYISYGHLSRKDEIVLGSIPAIFLSALNLSGYLDGLGQSQKSGILSGLSWLFASLTVGLISDIPPIFIGVSYSVGTLITIAFYFIFLEKELKKIKFLVSREGISQYLRDGFGCSLSIMPGQIYGRVLIYLVYSSLGQVISGVYIYLRNIHNLITRFIVFSRRVEFPYLIKASSGANIISIKSIFIVQKTSILILMLMILGVGLFFLLSSLDAVIKINALIFLPIVILWFVSSSVGQFLLAKGEFIEAGLISVIIFSGSAFLVYISIEYLGLYAVVFSEVITYSIQTIIYLLRLGVFKAK